MILAIVWCIVALMSLANLAMFGYIVSYIKINGAFKGDYLFASVFLVVLIGIWYILYSMNISKVVLHTIINFFKV